MRFLSWTAGAVLLLIATMHSVAVELDVRLWTEPPSLDFQKTGPDSQDAIVGDLFEGLVADAADGTVMPGQAASWVVTPDGLTYTFHLREGILWSDGTPVVASDFVFGMRRMVDPTTEAGAAFILSPIRNAEDIMAGKLADPTQLGVSAPDDRTLIIKLAAPMPALLQVLVQFPAYPLPEHAMDHSNFADPLTFPTNGPYKVASWTPGVSATLVRNDRYYAADRVAMDEVTYHFVADDSAAAAGFKAGGYDVVTRVDPSAVPDLRASLRDQVHIVPWGGLQWMALKLDHAPLDSPAVRRAMSMAINRDALGTIVGTQQIGAWGLVPPGTPGFETDLYAPDWAALPYPRRLEEATAALAAAGYTPKHPLHILLRHSLRPDRVALSEAVAGMWARIGIDVELRGADVSVHQQAVFDGDFDAAASHWVMDYSDASDMLVVLTTEMPINYGGYSNRTFDTLISQAANEQNPTRRVALMRRAEVAAMADNPIIPLYWMVSANLVSHQLTGYVDNVRNVHRTRWLGKPR